MSRLRALAGEMERPNLWLRDKLVVSAWTFGPLLEGPESLDHVDLVLVVDRPVEEVTWGTEPPEAAGIIELLRLDRLPVATYWRPAAWPVWNHRIRVPVRFWSPEGPDREALDALAQRRFADLPRPTPTPAEEREQLLVERDACLEHLRRVQNAYWDPRWRRNHSIRIKPEEHLWNAVHGYLDVLSGLAALPAVPPQRGAGQSPAP